MKTTASPEEIKKFKLRVDDVIVTKDSEEWNDIAIPAYVMSDIPNLICGYHLAQIRPDQRLIRGKYLFWLLSANSINYQYMIEASGVTRYGLGNYALSNSMILIPPRGEQNKIADYLDQKTTQIDGQVAREQKSIGLLKEYRTSLISEVVTGKIDVRG
jgi:type I restriction enzyme S subunit